VPDCAPGAAPMTELVGPDAATPTAVGVSMVGAVTTDAVGEHASATAGVPEDTTSHAAVHGRDGNIVSGLPTCVA
jgi:hypothetical protein